MNIILVKEELKNFKGIKNLALNFKGSTSIYGDNGTGKTTIYDAFNWCLFGKDSSDKKDFAIQPLDASGNVVHHLETKVDLTLLVDGVEIVFTRVFKEKWTKHKGQLEAAYEGNKTEYYIDGVPQKQKDYNAKIDDLMSSELFKLVSNPLYFNSLDWKKQREILLSITGNVEDSNVINYKEELKPLEKLLGNNSVDDFRKKLKAQISKLKKDKEGIPSRIDECNTNKVTADWAALEIEKQSLLNKVKDIDLQIADKSKANEGKAKLQEELFKVQADYDSNVNKVKESNRETYYKLKEEYSSKLLEAKSQASKPLMEFKEKLSNAREDCLTCGYKIKEAGKNLEQARKEFSNITKQIETCNTFRNDLMAEWNKKNDEKFIFDDSLASCSTCGREYDPDKIQEIKSNAESKFNANKQKQLSAITERGKGNNKVLEDNKKKLEVISKNIEEYSQDMLELNRQMNEYETEFKKLEEEESKLKEPTDITFPGQQELALKIHECEKEKDNVTFEGKEELEAKISKIKENIQAFRGVDNSSLINQKDNLQSQIDVINKQLASKDNNVKLDVRIKELETEEKDIAVKIAELEGQDFLCEDFIRTKVELLESKINEKFNGEVSFKLFNQLVNGGLEETCICTVHGVTFTNVNNAGKINAGLKIIEVLSNHYEVSTSIFIDNAESNNAIYNPGAHQLIKLYVSDDKELRVEEA